MLDAERVITVTGENVDVTIADATKMAEAGDSEGARAKVQLVQASVNHILQVAAAEVENSEDASFGEPIEVNCGRSAGGATVDRRARLCEK
jgi:hypothetical protein